MTFGQAIKSGFSNYATFTGRATRSEYWYWILFAFLVGVGAGIIDRALVDSEFGLVGPLVSLALLLPNIAVAVRRLHDLNSVGWWVLIVITIIGIVILIIWFCQKGTAGPNRFGPDPLASS
jgi:uncharacterized membrane protein YhaH (DUF805 family)